MGAVAIVATIYGLTTTMGAIAIATVWGQTLGTTWPTKALGATWPTAAKATVPAASVWVWAKDLQPHERIRVCPTKWLELPIQSPGQDPKWNEEALQATEPTTATRPAARAMGSAIAIAITSVDNGSKTSSYLPSFRKTSTPMRLRQMSRNQKINCLRIAKNELKNNIVLNMALNGLNK